MIDLGKHRPALDDFWNADPFPHVVINDFWDEVVAYKIHHELPEPDSELWNGYYDNAIEYKKTLNEWDKFNTNIYQAFTYLSSPEFVGYLSNSLGIPGLTPDVGLHGGGLHYYPQGGKLNPHIDYSHHPKLGFRRKLNILIYFNHDWNTEHGGELGLWRPDQALAFGEPEKLVAPQFNSCVIFENSTQSYHGLARPSTLGRYSMAMYYLINDHSTPENTKANFLPTNEQQNDQSVLDLIETRKTQRINTNKTVPQWKPVENDGSEGKLIVATNVDHNDFGVMTDREKVSNGLYRFGGSPVVHKIHGISHCLIPEMTSQLWDARADYWHYSTITTQRYLIATNVASHPDQWTGHIEGLEKNLNPQDLPDRKNLFECIEPKCLTDLQSGQATILLDQTHEGYNSRWLWEWFYRSIDKYQIPARSVIFVTGDLMSPDLHNEWCDNNNILPENRICVFGYSLFEQSVYLASERDWSHEHITFEDHLAYKTENLDSIKTYNCLQKRPRSHRVWLFRELVDRGILDKGICTMNAVEEDMLKDHNGNVIGSVHFQDEYIDADTVKRLNTMLPLLPTDYGHYQTDDIQDFSHYDSGKWQMMLNKDILLDSWVSVISEANADERQCFCSEKIFKPIIQEHPFMVWGDRHTMAKMRELGYQTFSHWWSEDWDGKDMRSRLNGICEVLETLSARTSAEMLDMYTEMKEVLKYNSEIMVNKSSIEVGEELKFITGKVVNG